MEREVKFRAWDSSRNEMVYESESESKDVFIFSNIVWWRLGGNPDLMPVIGRKFITMMQYTGLKDKNGKEIYEGDIMRVKDNFNGEPDFQGVVSFIDGTFCLASFIQPENNSYTERERLWNDGVYEHHSLEITDANDREVIGNKYENPELLNS